MCATFFFFLQCGFLQASTEDRIFIFAVCVFWWIYLQVEELQAVQLVEEVMGESGQLAAMHVQALQLLQTPEGSTFQTLQRVIAQVELLQHPQATEGAGLDPCDVVAI